MSTTAEVLLTPFVTCGDAQGEGAAQGVVVREEGPRLRAPRRCLQDRRLHLQIPVLQGWSAK
jgi:hypothetical protein